MNEDNFLIVGLIGLVISGLFFYVVIKAAVKSALNDFENKKKSNLDYEIKIFKVLSEIAKKHDVPADRIAAIDTEENFLDSKGRKKSSWF